MNMDLLKPHIEKSIKKGIVTNTIRYLTADEEDTVVIAQANEPLDEEGRFVNRRVTARQKWGN